MGFTSVADASLEWGPSVQNALEKRKEKKRLSPTFPSWFVVCKRGRSRRSAPEIDADVPFYSFSNHSLIQPFSHPDWSSSPGGRVRPGLLFLFFSIAPQKVSPQDLPFINGYPGCAQTLPETSACHELCDPL
jgi:hypothetical protein